MMRADRFNGVVWVRDPQARRDPDGVPVDELRLRQVWTGEVLTLALPGAAAGEHLGLGYLFRLVMVERSLMRDVLACSVVLSLLALLPAFVMVVVMDRLMNYGNMSTLLMIVGLVAIAALWNAVLGFVRRRMISTVGGRVDARLQTMIFGRVLGLPIDYFERTQAGTLMHQVGQIQKVRDFLTGKMLATLLDMVTVVVMLPLLFYFDVTLTWIIIAAAGLCGVAVVSFMPAVWRAYGAWQIAEMKRSTVMLETVHGIRTVKSLALERTQREAFDRVTAEAAAAKERLGAISNWPQSIVAGLSRFMSQGVLLIGALMAVMEGRGSTGVLLAFMMLGQRLAQPLSGIAQLINDIEEVRGAISMASNVVDSRPENAGTDLGIKPVFEGAVRFEHVTFYYPTTSRPALTDVNLNFPAGCKIGLVGRSGSGKSTITRLLQGINREYEGYIKLDGNDLKSINLGHLRRSFGVVLQDNFLFRGTIRENIISGRPGLTLADAVRAARLAGAEEFIERMPAGYETMIEEGSPNISGGQRQRLAIARALISDPRILILDEATSALDPESEALVNANIERIAEGRTMVVVSHRLSSLTGMDQIVVLDRGQVMDVGRHEELVERCAVYRQLWLQQTRYMQTPKPSSPTAVAAR
jgi:ABC-type bacteriocin/lantibiotic exporter with double-glycine peptidase domain